MYASVKANGGFYIGRYEAGTTSETPRTSNVAEDVVIKKRSKCIQLCYMVKK